MEDLNITLFALEQGGLFDRLFHTEHRLPDTEHRILISKNGALNTNNFSLPLHYVFTIQINTRT
jgi:hypothetical protein